MTLGLTDMLENQGFQTTTSKRKFTHSRPQKPGFLRDFSLLKAKVVETGFLAPSVSPETVGMC